MASRSSAIPGHGAVLNAAPVGAGSDAPQPLSARDLAASLQRHYCSLLDNICDLSVFGRGSQIAEIRAFLQGMRVAPKNDSLLLVGDAGSGKREALRAAMNQLLLEHEARAPPDKKTPPGEKTPFHAVWMDGSNLSGDAEALRVLAEGLAVSTAASLYSATSGLKSHQRIFFPHTIGDCADTDRPPDRLATTTAVAAAAEAAAAEAAAAAAAAIEGAGAGAAAAHTTPSTEPVLLDSSDLPASPLSSGSSSSSAAAALRSPGRRGGLLSAAGATPPPTGRFMSPSRTTPLRSSRSTPLHARASSASRSAPRVSFPADLDVAEDDDVVLSSVASYRQSARSGEGVAASSSELSAASALESPARRIGPASHLLASPRSGSKAAAAAEGSGDEDDFMMAATQIVRQDDDEDDNEEEEDAVVSFLHGQPGSSASNSRRAGRLLQRHGDSDGSQEEEDESEYGGPTQLVPMSGLADSADEDDDGEDKEVVARLRHTFSPLRGGGRSGEDHDGDRLRRDIDSEDEGDGDRGGQALPLPILLPEGDAGGHGDSAASASASAGAAAEPALLLGLGNAPGVDRRSSAGAASASSAEARSAYHRTQTLCPEVAAFVMEAAKDILTNAAVAEGNGMPARKADIYSLASSMLIAPAATAEVLLPGPGKVATVPACSAQVAGTKRGAAGGAAPVPPPASVSPLAFLEGEGALPSDDLAWDAPAPPPPKRPRLSAGSTGAAARAAAAAADAYGAGLSAAGPVPVTTPEEAGKGLDRVLSKLPSGALRAARVWGKGADGQRGWSLGGVNHDAYEHQLGFVRTSLQDARAAGIPVVIIIDAFDQFLARSRQNLLYTLLDYTQSHDKLFALVGITTRGDCVDRMEKRLKSRFSQRQVFFKRHTRAALVLAAARLLQLPPSITARAPAFAAAWTADVARLIAPGGRLCALLGAFATQGITPAQLGTWLVTALAKGMMHAAVATAAPRGSGGEELPTPEALLTAALETEARANRLSDATFAPDTVLGITGALALWRTAGASTTPAATKAALVPSALHRVDVMARTTQAALAALSVAELLLLAAVMHVEQRNVAAEAAASAAAAASLGVAPPQSQLAVPAIAPCNFQMAMHAVRTFLSGQQRSALAEAMQRGAGAATAATGDAAAAPPSAAAASASSGSRRGGAKSGAGAGHDDPSDSADDDEDDDDDDDDDLDVSKPAAGVTVIDVAAGARAAAAAAAAAAGTAANLPKVLAFDDTAGQMAWEALLDAGLLRRVSTPVSASLGAGVPPLEPQLNASNDTRDIGKGAVAGPALEAAGFGYGSAADFASPSAGDWNDWFLCRYDARFTPTVAAVPPAALVAALKAARIPAGDFIDVVQWVEFGAKTNVMY